MLLTIAISINNNSSNPVTPTIVGASFVSLAPTFFKSEQAHAAAPPLQIKPALPGFDLVFTGGSYSFCIVTCTKDCQNYRIWRSFLHLAIIYYLP
jgi:hypothetical protein